MTVKGGFGSVKASVYVSFCRDGLTAEPDVGRITFYGSTRRPGYFSRFVQVNIFRELIIFSRFAEGSDAVAKLTCGLDNVGVGIGSRSLFEIFTRKGEVGKLVMILYKGLMGRVALFGGDEIRAEVTEGFYRLYALKAFGFGGCDLFAVGCRSVTDKLRIAYSKAVFDNTGFQPQLSPIRAFTI